MPKPSSPFTEDVSKLLWENHGKYRVSEGRITKYRIDQLEEGEFRLMEVLPDNVLPLVKGTLDYCKGFADGAEAYTRMLGVMAMSKKLGIPIGVSS